MRRPQPREVVLLLILAGTVLFYLWYTSGGPGETAEGERAAEAKGPAAEDAPYVLVALLRREAAPYDPQGRNLFQYAKRPPTPEELAALRRKREEEERRRREAEEARRRAAEQAAQRPQPAPPRAVAPQPPPIPFKYIGYFGPKDDKIAAFLDGEEVLVARAGETLRERFRVVEIRFDTVVIGYTDPRWEGQTREIRLPSGRRR